MSKKMASPRQGVFEAGLASFLIVLFSSLFWLPLFGEAQTENAPLGSSGDHVDDLQIVLALYGVDESFVDVTARISGLLHTSPNGFDAHEDTMGGDPLPGSSKSLIIVYNFHGHRHIFARRNDKGIVTMDLLKDSAKVDPTRLTPINITPASSIPSSASDTLSDVTDSPKVVLALYGVDESFMDTTDLVSKLIHNTGGFYAHEDVMKHDPLYGSTKSLVIVYNYQGHRHLFARRNDKGKVTADFLKDTAKTDQSSLETIN